MTFVVTLSLKIQIGDFAEHWKPILSTNALNNPFWRYFSFLICFLSWICRSETCTTASRLPKISSLRRIFRTASTWPRSSGTWPSGTPTTRTSSRWRASSITQSRARSPFSWTNKLAYQQINLKLSKPSLELSRPNKRSSYQNVLLY